MQAFVLFCMCMGVTGDEGGRRREREGRTYLWKTTKLTEIQLLHVLVAG